MAAHFEMASALSARFQPDDGKPNLRCGILAFRRERCAEPKTLRDPSLFDPVGPS
ncbi:MAG: hypothetical protein WCC64_12760 [Aliidongia sp.]